MNRGKGKIEQITFNSAKLGGEPLSCRFKTNENSDPKILNLEKEEKQETTLICEKELKEQKSYSTTLTLDLSFKYEQTENKKITILS